MFEMFQRRKPPEHYSLRELVEHQDHDNHQHLHLIREELMAVSKQVQDALDRVRQTQSISVSVKQGIDVLHQQNADLSAKITELQAKLDAGNQISPDDLAALAEISSDADNVNAQLQSAITANTNQGGASAPSGSQAGTTEPGGVAGSAGSPTPAADAGAAASAASPTSPGPATAPDGSALVDDSAARGSEASQSSAKPLAGTGS